MRIELVVIGSELTSGAVLDTNTQGIARVLREIGGEVERVTVVGDDCGRIAAAVREAAGRAEAVIVSGGLGPTVDDPTREAVAAAAGAALEFHPELWETIRERFSRLGRAPTDNNRKQARLPAGAAALPNPFGTAPGFSLRIGGATVFAVPGVPREMEAMLADHVVPALRRLGGGAAVIRARVLHAAGLGESSIDEKIGRWESSANPAVGLTARAGITDIRIVARAADPAAADSLIAGAEADIRAALGLAVYGADGETLAGAVLRRLPPGGALATVESGTRGELAGQLEAENSEAFRGGWIAARPGAGTAGMLREWTAARGASHGVGLLLEPVERGYRSRIFLAFPGGESEQERQHFVKLALAQEWAAVMALLALQAALRGSAGG